MPTAIARELRTRKHKGAQTIVYLGKIPCADALHEAHSVPLHANSGNLPVPGFLEMLDELARELGQPDIKRSNVRLFVGVAR